MASVPAPLLHAEMSDNKNAGVGGGEAQCKCSLATSRKQKLPAPAAKPNFCEDAHTAQAEQFFLSACSNGMIYTPTEMSLDAACLNQGEETEREHEGHVRMISHAQLPAGPHLAVSTAPVSQRNKNNFLYRMDGLHKPAVPW